MASHGDLLPVDINALGKIDGVGYRIHGDRRVRARGIGWEQVHVAVDDHSRIAFVKSSPTRTDRRVRPFSRAPWRGLRPAASPSSASWATTAAATCHAGSARPPVRSSRSGTSAPGRTPRGRMGRLSAHPDATARVVVRRTVSDLGRATAGAPPLPSLYDRHQLEASLSCDAPWSRV